MAGMFDVAGKTVLITGGARGIGAMIAGGFLDHGAKVYLTSRRADPEQVRQLQARGDCTYLPSNLATVAGTKDLAHRIGELESRIDVLVNNAGATWGAPIEEYPEEGWDKVMSLNLKSAFFLVQALLPQLRAAATTGAPARVINIASVHGLYPAELETFAYSSSKAGLIMLTRHLAKRLARENILVNAIAPGPFATDMMAATIAAADGGVEESNPLRRLGRPEEIAGVAIFLASAAGGYTTGATIPCDGGSAAL
jgi:NAD(P)-dependent dehydrogenase (short-subunit alcohol dehydrogenase family)